MPNRPDMSPRVPPRADACRRFDSHAGSGMGADSAFEEMIRSRPVVHRPASPALPPLRGYLARRRLRG